MKNIILLFALLGLATIIGCGSDDASEGTLLRHDGDNNTAPFLPGGIHEAAARFSSDVVSNFTGQQITEVLFYMEDLPSTLEIRIYEGGGVAPTGPAVREQAVTGEVVAGGFTTVRLSEPFTLGTDPVWVSVRMTLFEEGQAIGCDAGPRNPNGDFINFSLQGWNTFLAETMARQPNNENAWETINWNIRARVE